MSCRPFTIAVLLLLASNALNLVAARAKVGVVSGGHVNTTISISGYTATMRVLPGFTYQYAQRAPLGTDYDWTQPFTRIRSSNRNSLWEQLADTPNGNRYFIGWNLYPSGGISASEMVWTTKSGACKSLCGRYSLPGYFPMPNEKGAVYNGTNVDGNRVFLNVLNGWFQMWVARPDADLLVSFGEYVLHDNQPFDASVLATVPLPGVTPQSPKLQMPCPSKFAAHYILAIEMSSAAPPKGAKFPPRNINDSKPRSCRTARSCINGIYDPKTMGARHFVAGQQCCATAGGFCQQNATSPTGGSCIVKH